MDFGGKACPMGIGSAALEAQSATSVSVAIVAAQDGAARFYGQDDING